MAFNLDEKLKEFATDRQWEILLAWREHGSQRKASEKIGLAKVRFDQVKKAVLKHAAMHGYSPDHDMTRQAPDPFVVKGTSTYYNKDGLMAGQWVKTAIDGEKRKEMMDAAIAAMCEEIKPCEPIPFNGGAVDSLLTKYVITDFHLGMMAWYREGGSNWDLKIAEDVLVSAMHNAITRSPKSKIGYYLQLGDFLHFDGIEAVTPTSKHVLDADSRFGKIIEVAIRVTRKVVSMLLDHHEHVHIVWAEGNHDTSSSIILRSCLNALYENEKRVTVDTSQLPYYAYQWGNVMLTSHHTHLKKFNDVDRAIAAMFPEMWGDTLYRYFDAGHHHHKQVKEEYGIIKEMHQTLAAKDAYASRGAYEALRSMVSVTYDKTFGEVSRLTVSPEMCMPEGYDK